MYRARMRVANSVSQSVFVGGRKARAAILLLFLSITHTALSVLSVVPNIRTISFLLGSSTSSTETVRDERGVCVCVCVRSVCVSQ